MNKKKFRLVLWSFGLLLFISNIGYAQAPSFTIGSAVNVTTTNITIPVTASNFNQVLAWQGSINWDNSKLNYVSISSPITQLTGIQFNASVASNTGRLSFVWIDNNLNVQTIASNSVLFSITFSVVNGASGGSDLLFANSPTQLLLSNSTGTAVNNVSYNNGNVSFPASVLVPQFAIGSLVNVITSTVVIPVTSKNFIQILAWQGSINWDNTKLTFQNISNINAQLNGFQSTSSVTGSTGKISFIWSDENLLPQTISDNSLLFNITLNVVSGATGSAAVFFAADPTALILSNAQGGTISSPIYNSGTISFPGASLPPEFILGSLYDISTSTITVPVTVKNFAQLLACQGSINWDLTKLSFLSISNPVSQLTGMLSNATVSGTTGRLSFLWTDANLIAQTIADNTVIFTITFNVLGGNSGYSQIYFSNVPTTLLLSNATANSIANSTFTNNTTTFSGDLCFGGSTTVTSSIIGAGYQWQVNTGTGFVNISNNANYSGTTTNVLGLNNVPAAWAGYQFRCMVNGANSNPFILKFRNYFTGAINTSWENINNWSCTSLPDDKTDVVITSGTLVLNSNATCKSVTVGSGAVFRVATGFILNLIGP